MLRQMARARRFNRWMSEVIAPYLGPTVLELGAGIGNLSEFLCRGRELYVATDTETGHLNELRVRAESCRNLQTALCDASEPAQMERFRGRFDTVVCLNVLEHIADDEGTLHNIFSALRPGGSAVVLVPQGLRAFGKLDEVLKHKRRYTRQDLRAKMKSAGFQLQEMLGFNRVTYPSWIVNSRWLRRQTLSDFQLACFDALVPVWRRVDNYLPWPSTSLIAVGQRPE